MRLPKRRFTPRNSQANGIQTAPFLEPCAYFLVVFVHAFSRLIFDAFFDGFRVDFGTILGYVFDVFSLFCEVLYRSGALLKITFFRVFYNVF